MAFTLTPSGAHAVDDGRELLAPDLRRPRCWLRPRKPAAPQRGHQVVGVHQRAPRCVDQQRAVVTAPVESAAMQRVASMLGQCRVMVSLSGSADIQSRRSATWPGSRPPACGPSWPASPMRTVRPSWTGIASASGTRTLRAPTASPSTPSAACSSSPCAAESTETAASAY